MTELQREKLNKILEEHKHWIDEDCKNWEEMRANLSDTNLRDADLRGVYLHNADLRGADLSDVDLSDACLNIANLSGADLNYANLRDADLSSADLHYANLHNANLCKADLRNANLCKADLRSAYLHRANLSGAVLSGADLRDAVLSGADLNYANLRDADLSGADLRDAVLSGADLSGAKNVPHIPNIPMICPEEGDFIGWKKAEGNKNKVIVKLHIPSDAKRSSATTRKCRCSKAEVIAIYNLDGTEAEERKCHSDYDNSFIYEVGKTVEVTDFSEDRWNECAKGIHFFINRQEAINY